MGSKRVQVGSGSDEWESVNDEMIPWTRLRLEGTARTGLREFHNWHGTAG